MTDASLDFTGTHIKKTSFTPYGNFIHIRPSKRNGREWGVSTAWGCCGVSDWRRKHLSNPRIVCKSFSVKMLLERVLGNCTAFQGGFPQQGRNLLQRAAAYHHHLPPPHQLPHKNCCLHARGGHVEPSSVPQAQVSAFVSPLHSQEKHYRETRKTECSYRKCTGEAGIYSEDYLFFFFF